jgi:hypothetical protein
VTSSTGLRREGGQAAIAALGVLVLLALAAAGFAALARASVVRSQADTAADAAALAGAVALRNHRDDLYPRRDPITRRTLPPLLDVPAYEHLAIEAAGRAAAASGAFLTAVEFDPAAHEPGPLSLRVEVVVRGDRLPRWIGDALRRRLRTSRSRAGVELGVAPTDPASFRPVDLTGYRGVAAVVAAAEAQLGWPYVWGGESRAEGGFDCSGLVAYALEAAGYGVGRPTAAGFQALAQPVPLSPVSLVPGDLVFVGAPAHHVGLYVAEATVIEAPYTGAVVHLEPLAAGGWTSAGRLPQLVDRPSPDDLPPAEDGGELPGWVPAAFRPWIAEAARLETVPPALLAAQLEAESGFDPRAVSDAGAQGVAQFMPGTWAGSWNPYRDHSPFEPRYAVLAQARYLGTLLARAGGDVPRALAAYNAGWEGSAHAWPAETRAYVARIMRRFAGPAAIARPLQPGVPGADGRGGGTVVRLLPLDPSEAGRHAAA